MKRRSRCPFSEETAPKVRWALGAVLVVAVILLLTLCSGCGSSNPTTGATTPNYPEGWPTNPDDYPLIFSTETVYDSGVLIGDCIAMEPFGLCYSSPRPADYIAYGYDYVGDREVWILSESYAVTLFEPEGDEPYQFYFRFDDASGTGWSIHIEVWPGDPDPAKAIMNIFPPVRLEN